MRVLGKHEGLTRTEVKVLRMVGRGWTDQQIGAALRVRADTVRSFHLFHIMTKLNLHNRVLVAVYALRHGYVSLDDIDFGRSEIFW